MSIIFITNLLLHRSSLSLSPLSLSHSSMLECNHSRKARRSSEGGRERVLLCGVFVTVVAFLMVSDVVLLTFLPRPNAHSFQSSNAVPLPPPLATTAAARSAATTSLQLPTLNTPSSIATEAPHAAADSVAVGGRLVVGIGTVPRPDNAPYLQGTLYSLYNQLAQLATTPSTVC
jgi:hypothetical protein